MTKLAEWSDEDDVLPLSQRRLNLLPEQTFVYDLMPPLLKMPEWASVFAPAGMNSGKVAVAAPKVSVTVAATGTSTIVEMGDLLPPPVPPKPTPVAPPFVLEGVESFAEARKLDLGQSEKPLQTTPRMGARRTPREGAEEDLSAPPPALTVVGESGAESPKVGREQGTGDNDKVEPSSPAVLEEPEGGMAASGTPVVRANMYGISRPDLPSTPLPRPPGDGDEDDDEQETTSNDTEEDVAARLQKQAEDGHITDQEQYALAIAKEGIMSSPLPGFGGPVSAVQAEGKDRKSKRGSWRKSWKKDDDKAVHK